MRYIITVLLVTLVVATICTAQVVLQDVVYLKNGGVMRGTILELVPEKSVKLQTRDGNVFVYAMEEIDRIAKEEVPADEAEPKNRMESWYLHFALGYGGPSYPSQLQRMLDLITSLSNSTHTSVSLEIPGVYFPLRNDQTMLGGALTGIGDRYAVSGSWMQINQYLLAVSAWHFLTDKIGDGFYVRGDAGLAWLVIQDSDGNSSSSDSGFGILVGGGYSLPVSSGTRITFNLNYGARWVEDETYGAVSINVGVLL